MLTWCMVVTNWNLWIVVPERRILTERIVAPESRIQRAAAQRLQAMVKRVCCDDGVKGRAMLVLLAVCRRCVVERRYRMVLHRPIMKQVSAVCGVRCHVCD